ncbi:MAG: integrase core domain-containing protein [Candidatus Thiodiazotropha sp. (ex Lucinoma borealis)]|nr:integrase core domain-containing protein [Candidatus Thiodiazotropha sp. (ex Lucinoma borealis)]
MATPATFLAYISLGVFIISSLLFQSVSNDNPFSESLFKTLKYVPSYPSKPFSSVDEARRWLAGFTDLYNHSHHHSGLKFVTPVQHHDGQGILILKQRKAVYEERQAA